MPLDLPPERLDELDRQVDGMESMMPPSPYTVLINADVRALVAGCRERDQLGKWVKSAGAALLAIAEQIGPNALLLPPDRLPGVIAALQAEYAALRERAELAKPKRGMFEDPAAHE